MKRSLNSLLILILLVTGVKVHAQYTNTLYWLDNTTVQHQFNPSFQPYYNFYIGIPLLNRLSANGTTTFPTFKAAGFTKGQAFVYETDKQQLLNALPSLLTSGEMLLDIGLLDFGFRYNSHYFTFTLSERFDITAQLPKGSIDLLMNGSELSNGISTTMDMLTLQSKAYTELAFGYSHRVSDKVGFGTKLKLLA
ncbi:MAG: DUF5723 family protein, partial [Ignavibacteria bacterium]|nr:DUF5723 family protein [Ignavibacteria bacterium]